jgi:hypothetical protein
VGLKNSSLVRNVFSKSAFSNVLETLRDFLAKELASLDSLLKELYNQVTGNDLRALSVVAPHHCR